MNKKLLKTINILLISSIFICCSLAVIHSVNNNVFKAETNVESSIKNPGSEDKKVSKDMSEKDIKAIQATRIASIVIAVTFILSVSILFSVLRIQKIKKDKIFQERAKIEREIRDKREKERLEKEKI